jgi:hypothetical protein
MSNCVQHSAEVVLISASRPELSKNGVSDAEQCLELFQITHRLRSGPRLVKIQEDTMRVANMCHLPQFCPI